MHYLHNIALSWANGRTGLEIESSATLPGLPLENALPLEAFESAVSADDGTPSASPSTPPLAYTEDPDGFYEPLRLRENTDYNIFITLPGTKDEIEHEMSQSKPGNPAWPFVNPRLGRVFKLYSPRTWQVGTSADGGQTVTVFGALNFSSFVGTVDLSLGTRYTVRVEVACSKLGYFDDFKTLLTEVSNEVVELLFEVDSAAGFRFEASEPEDTVPSVELFHLRRLMAPDALPLAVETVIRAPHTRLVSSTTLVHPARAIAVDPIETARIAGRLPYEMGGSGGLGGSFLGFSPQVLPERLKREDVDTPENRYVKAFLVKLSAVLQRLVDILARGRKQASLREVRRWSEMVDEWLEWPSWTEVGEMTYIPSNSQVLLRRNGYREIWEADLTLEYGLKLQWKRGAEIAEAVGDIRPIFELYEYWCYFAMLKALRTVCGPETQAPSSLSVSRKTGLEIDLRKGQQSEVRFEYPDRNGGSSGRVPPVEVRLFYNRQFLRRQAQSDYQDASYSTGFRPDCSLLISSEGLMRHWLHFDAKYRLDIKAWERQVSNQVGMEDVEQELDAGEGKEPVGAGEEPAAAESDTENADLYMKTDLYKMHTYRDAILGSRGAYVLFPGSGVRKRTFVKHYSAAYRRMYSVPSVGALPLRPQTGEDQQDSLVSFLSEILSDLTQVASAYQEELGIHAAGTST